MSKHVGLVLSGGGINAFVHIGVYKYLQELGIRPVIIGWTSAWSAFWALIAAGFDWTELSDYCENLERRMKSVKDVDWTWISKCVAKFDLDHAPWILKGERITEEIRGLLESKGVKKFQDLKIPFFLHAVNLNTAEDVRFSSFDPELSEREIIDYVRASISLPGILPPKRIWNDYYVDGGIKSNYPFRSAAELCEENGIRLDELISVNVLEKFNPSDSFENESFLEIMMRSMAIAIQDQYESDVEIFRMENRDVRFRTIDVWKPFKNSLLTGPITKAVDIWYESAKKAFWHENVWRLELGKADFSAIARLRKKTINEKVKYRNWVKFIWTNPKIATSLFQDCQTDLELSRRSVRQSALSALASGNKADYENALIRILAWWYPDGRVGTIAYAKYVYEHFDSYVESVMELVSTDWSDSRRLAEFQKGRLKYFGISTLSKILFFFDVKVWRMPAAIMDDVVVSQLEKRYGIRLDRDMADSYPAYLSLLEKTLGHYKNAGDLPPETDQWDLELFIFSLKR